MQWAQKLDRPQVSSHKYSWWPTEALISQDGTISLTDGVLYPHSRDSTREVLMRAKHHLVLDNCTTNTHKNKSKLLLQQTDPDIDWVVPALAREYVTTHTTAPLSCISFLDSEQLLMTVEGTSFIPSHSLYFVQVEARGHFSDCMRN